MFRSRILHSVALVLGATLLWDGSRAAAEPPAKHAIEFQTFPGVPESEVRYRFSLIVTVEGSTKTFEERNSSGDAGLSGDAIAFFLGANMKDDGGWKCSWSGPKLTIEGWTDPKTKKFHPTKRIRFESPNLPKGYFPIITPNKV